MKNSTLLAPVTVLVLLSLLFGALNAKANKYTVAQSGLFTKTTTWAGGLVPPLSLSTGDTVVIPANLTLKLDTAFAAEQQGAVLIIDGVLTDTFRLRYLAPTIHYPLTAGYTSLNGAGVIDLDTIFARQGLVINFSGHITVGHFYVHGLEHRAGAEITVIGELHLKENDYLFTNGKFTMAYNSSVRLYRGYFKTPANSTAVYDFSQKHKLYYLDTGRVFGLEYQSLPSQEIHLYTPIALEKDFVLNSLISTGTYYISIDVDSYKFTIGPHAVITGSNKLTLLTNEHSTLELRNDTAGNKFLVGTRLKSLIVNMPDPKASASLFCTQSIIGDTLRFVSGKLKLLGRSTLYLDTNAVITGVSDSSYVTFGQEFKPGPAYDKHLAGLLALPTPMPGDSLFFPIGTENYFSPITIYNLTGISGQYSGASVYPGVKQYGNDGQVLSDTRSAVGHTWLLPFLANWQSDSVLVELMWPADAEVNSFNRDSAFASVAPYTDNTVGVLPFEKSSEYTAITKNAMGYYSTRKKISTIQHSGIRTYINYLTVFDNKTFLSVPDIIDPAQTVRLYPNPAGDILYVEMAGDMATQAKIYNNIGQLIKIAGVENGQPLSISELNPGIYHIRLAGSETNCSAVFVKR